MIGEVSCRKARIWLQEPETLDPLDARHLDRHLLECDECADYRKSQIVADRLVKGSLSTAAMDLSVHGRVRERLAQESASVQRVKSRGWAGRRTPRLFASGLGLGAAATMAALAAVFVPSLISPRSPATPAIAAFHPPRPFNGYPLTIDPIDPNHLLVGAWGEVYESFTGGAPWHQLAALPADLVIRDLAIDSRDPHRYLVATKRSILVSNDSGAHWTTTAKNMLGIENMFLLQDPNKPDTFYSGPSVVWKSTDRGESWRIPGAVSVFAPDGIQALAVAPDGRLFTGIWHGGVAVSSDGGKTWKRLGRGLAKDVMSVAVVSQSELWAATDQGPYVSRDGGKTWRAAAPGRHLFTTSVLPLQNAILIGGNGGISRSIDGGRTWKLSVDGLPLAPYVNTLFGDPKVPNRVYASLNGDGIYRSEDSGKTWTQQTQGLPLYRQEGAQDIVLFKRAGSLWTTNHAGTDPGELTVDSDVHHQVLSPDGQSIAYLAGDGAGPWAVRVIASGGSGSKTILAGSNGGPSSLLWSPESSRLAVVRSKDVTMVDVSSHTGKLAGLPHWPLSSGDRVLAWTRDGNGLLVWSRLAGRVRVRNVGSGLISLTEPGNYPRAPAISGDGKRIALVIGSRLRIGGWDAQVIRRLQSTGCRGKSWSNDTSRFLLSCPGWIEIRASGGSLIARMSFRGAAGWSPGSNDSVLFFHGGGLWTWSPGSPARQIVPNAEP